MLKRIALLAVASTALAAPALAQGDIAAGEKVFRKCKACHAVGANAKNRVGPSLNGVVGRVWGAVEDYKYSEGKDGTLKQLAESEGKVWDIPTLTAYLIKPKDVIPAGKMAFPGLKKEEDLVNVIAYLASFDETGAETDPAPVLEGAAGS